MACSWSRSKCIYGSIWIVPAFPCLRGKWFDSRSCIAVDRRNPIPSDCSHSPGENFFWKYWRLHRSFISDFRRSRTPISHNLANKKGGTIILSYVCPRKLINTFFTSQQNHGAINDDWNDIKDWNKTKSKRNRMKQLLSQLYHMNYMDGSNTNNT